VVGLSQGVVGGFALGLGERAGERKGEHGECLRMQKSETSVSGEFAKKVSIGTENFVLITVRSCGVSIGEPLEQKRRVRAV
jgi:hypothetical protein